VVESRPRFQLGTVSGPNIIFDKAIEHNMRNIDVTLDYTGLPQHQGTSV